ncbi:MAG: ABC transporter permease [Eubacteriales bacterium]|nr:ABC transporter permease [Eubacteriales bacterium]
MNVSETVKKVIRFNPLSLQIRPELFQRSTESEKQRHLVYHKPSSFFKDGTRRFFHNPIAVISLVFVVLLVLAVIILPQVWPYDYSSMLAMDDSTMANLRPFQWGSSEKELIAAGTHLMPHIFGTDRFGRDYFIRVIYGARISLLVGFFASLIVLIIGSLYGSIAGYCGGKVDLVMMRIVDIIYSLPDLLIIILLSSVLNKTLDLNGHPFLAKMGVGMISIFIVFGLLYWVGMARLVRGQILSIKQEDFVLAAKASGASGFWIIWKHLLPNSMSVIIISVALQIPSAIFTESFLSFLGLGVNAPMPSLGSLASDALSGIRSYPYRLVIPAVTICLIVLALNLLGDGLRDAFDPKLSK